MLRPPPWYRSAVAVPLMVMARGPGSPSSSSCPCCRRRRRPLAKHPWLLEVVPAPVLLVVRLGLGEVLLLLLLLHGW